MKINDLPNAADFFKYNPETGEIVNKRTGKKAGYINAKGYVRLNFKGTDYQAHRIAWTIYHGAPPEGEIDHINHIKHDNRIENLRDVPTVMNARNLGVSSRNNSGVVGVSFHNTIKKWRARIRVDDREIHLGTFDTMKEAIQARQFGEDLYGFHPNHGRP